MRNLFIAVLLFVVAGCENDLAKVNLVASQKELPVEHGTDIEMLYSTYGDVKVELIAPTMERHVQESPYMEFNDGLRLYFYDDEKNIDSRLSANYGIAFEEEEEMIVRNDVVVINVKGEKLNTEELIWKQTEHKIYSNKFVKITTADEIIFGEGLESNEEFTEYTVKNIRGTISIEDDTAEEDE